LLAEIFILRIVITSIGGSAVRTRLYLINFILVVSHLNFESHCFAFAEERDVSSLSPEEENFLKQGKISDRAFLTGAFVGTTLPIIPAYLGNHDQDDTGLRLQTALLFTAFPTLGVGQLIQGRYLESGWWFSASEGVLSVLLYNSYKSGSINSAAVAWEFLGLLVARGWELVDLWTGSQSHNRRWENLKNKQAEQKQISIFVLPRENGGHFGLEANFQWAW
jgi:hypothetical protein